MNTDTHDDLDQFERALLADLRDVVVHRRPERRRTRALTLGGVAASAAALVGVGLAVGGSSPAFAVDHEADGDIVVTISRLDDAGGLEDALAAQGVAAEVDYVHPIRMRTTDGKPLDVIPLPDDGPANGDGKRVELIQRGVAEGEETLDCGFGRGGYISLAVTDEGYVITIPRESVQADTSLRITTSETAGHEAHLAVSTHDGRCVQLASPPVGAGS